MKKRGVEMSMTANEAFYTWEEQTQRTDLSDRDREIFTAGYLAAQKQAIVDKEKNNENLSDN